MKDFWAYRFKPLDYQWNEAPLRSFARSNNEGPSVPLLVVPRFITARVVGIICVFH